MSKATLVHIADRVLNRPLMILPEKLALIASVLEGRLGLDASDLQGQAEALPPRHGPDASSFVGTREPADASNPNGPRKPYRTTAGGVAIIPVVGSLVNRYSWIDAASGVTSYEQFKHTIGLAAADDAVNGIVLDMDSPGGEAVGCFEAADAVRAVAAVKPVTAVVNGMAASAAYAIASAASRIVTTASGISGSIGVVMMHADYSHALHEAGVKPTLIFAGARKVDGNPYTPLTDDVKASLKAEIEEFYDLFAATVAKGRKGLSLAAIKGTEARTYIGEAAVKAGLADAVGTFETALADLSHAPAGRLSKTRTSGANMENETPAPAAEAPVPAPQTAAPGVAQAAHDAAVASARAEGEKAGAAAERARIGAILGHANAAGRAKQAAHLAFKTDQSVDAAADLMAASATEGSADAAAFVAAKEAQPVLSLEPDTAGPGAKADAGFSWDDIVADMNKALPSAR